MQFDWLMVVHYNSTMHCFGLLIFPRRLYVFPNIVNKILNTKFDKIPITKCTMSTTEAANKRQRVDYVEGRFTAVSNSELNLLLENRHLNTTKNATNWAVKTFKGFLYTVYCRNKANFCLHVKMAILTVTQAKETKLHKHDILKCFVK